MIGQGQNGAEGEIENVPPYHKAAATAFMLIMAAKQAKDMPSAKDLCITNIIYAAEHANLITADIDGQTIKVMVQYLGQDWTVSELKGMDIDTLIMLMAYFQKHAGLSPPQQYEAGTFRELARKHALANAAKAVK